jgi:hypothetical protein
MRTRIAVDFLPAASFGPALRRGTGAFAARPDRPWVWKPGLLDQPLPPRPAGGDRPTRRRALVTPPLAACGWLVVRERGHQRARAGCAWAAGPEGIFEAGMKLVKHPAFETLMGLRALRQFPAAQPQRNSSALLRSSEVSHPGTDGAKVSGQADPGGLATAQEPVRQKNIVLL